MLNKINQVLDNPAWFCGLCAVIGVLALCVVEG